MSRTALNNDARLVSVKEAADRLSVSPRFIWARISAGKIRTVRMGAHRRVPVEEIQRVEREGLE